MDIREKTLPVLAPKADEDDIKAVTDTLRSGWWINGPKVKEFESQFAKMVGKKHAIAVTSNTHALDLVLKAHEINGKDSEVLSPTMSFATTVAVPLPMSQSELAASPESVTGCQSLFCHIYP